MSKENAEKSAAQSSQSLQEFLLNLGIPLLAENLDGADYTPETLSELSVNELQENFMLSKETAKNVYSRLDRFRKPEAAKQQIKGLTSMLTQLLTNSNRSKKESDIFKSAFDHVTGIIDFQPVEDHPMDPCSSACSATYHFFKEDFDRNFEEYRTYSNLNDWTPLMYACAIWQDKIVDKLLTQNPDLCVQNNEKQTALMLAACFGHVKILEKLIHYSKERSKQLQKYFAEIAGVHLVDSAGFTALHYAVYYGQEEAVKYLLETCNADPNIPDKDGMTPTLIACTDEALKNCYIDLINAKGNPALRNKEGKSGFDLQKTFWRKKHEQQVAQSRYGQF